MSRAVPRHQRDVSVEKGDIQALSTGNNCLFACTSDGSIQCVLYTNPYASRLHASRPCGNLL